MADGSAPPHTPPIAASAGFSMRRHPAQVLRVFTIGSILGIVAILALVGVGVRHVYYRHIVAHATVNAIQLAQAAVEEERGTLIADGPGDRTLAVKRAALPRLDEHMRRYLRPFDVVKIKIFARDGRIVYSTDGSIIGRSEHDNVRLARALRGEVVSVRKTRGQGGDLEGERTFDADLVETYVPIRDGDRIIGGFETYMDVAWSRTDVREALTVSTMIAVVVLFAVFGGLYVLMRALTRQLSAAEHELEQMAITDGLTGLANRRYLMARAEEECARLARQRDKDDPKTGVGFIMVDVDHFKRINDTHGHLAGDRVLREIAARLRRETRRYDIVGRYGGEEFLVVLPEADETETRSVAQRVWQTMRESPFAVPDGVDRVTVSVGCACATAGNEDLNAVLRRADEALYRAKGEGRDRIVV